MIELGSRVKIGESDMKVKKIKIKGIGGIKDELFLEFNSGLNIICGINGTCKTTILECIAHFFSYGESNIKKNTKADIGKCEIETDVPKKEKISYIIEEFVPIKKEYSYSQQKENEELLYFKTHRDFLYSELSAVPRDVNLRIDQYGEITTKGVAFYDFKGWFFNRYFSAKEPSDLLPEQISNFRTAKECFNILDKDVYFSKAKTDTYDIILHTKQGDIYFEYLSAGYKSCLYILMGIIKEIEYRFKNPIIAVKDFNGLILIDEIDLHLHPIWQSTIVKSMKEIFTNAQIIVTTHSPHIIQSAEPKEVIPLVIDEDNNIVVKKTETNEYGYQGWTIEEILKNVMGMETTNSELYNQTVKSYDNAVDTEDYTAANEKYEILKKMLHPKNPLRKILDIQMAGVENEL